MVTGVRNVKSRLTDKSWEFQGLKTNCKLLVVSLDWMFFNPVVYNSQTPLSQMVRMCQRALLLM